MRYISHAIWLILCLLKAQMLFSQELEFATSTFDFGTIAEDGGEVSHTFTFKNSGDSPAVIISANSSCGCTVPEYNRAPIVGGGTSSIMVTFDPMNRPGKFAKTVQVLVAPTNKVYVLTISGDVTPRKKSTEEEFPFDMGGGLRIAANYFPLSHVEQGERRETQVSYINTSKRPIKITLQGENPSGMMDISTAFTIPAGQKGTLAAAYDLREKPFFGAMSDRFAVAIDGKESKYKLIFNGHAIDKFISDDYASPPICNLSTRVVRFGEVTKGVRSAARELIIENSGTSELIVRAVEVDWGAICTLEAGAVVAPSEQRRVEVWVDGSELGYGNFSRYIIFTVNDPDDPSQRIRVVGEVIK
ncbi:MAG: DUF1573 domain-containing protein [Rikenellaceae bacterium]